MDARPPLSSSCEAVDEQTSAVEYVLKLACACVVRGGYTLQDTALIREAIDAFSADASAPAPTPTDAGDADGISAQRLRLLGAVIDLVEKSQRLGKLSLAEAWAAHNAVHLLSSSGGGAASVRPPKRPDAL